MKKEFNFEKIGKELKDMNLEDHLRFELCGLFVDLELQRKGKEPGFWFNQFKVDVESVEKVLQQYGFCLKSVGNGHYYATSVVG